MLLIGLMLTGCGQIKNFIHPETKVDPKINADLAEIKAELAALKTKSDGWWNWRLGEDGWMSWINTPAIAITTAVFIVYSLRNIHSLYNKFVDHINNYYNPSMDAVEEMQKKVNEHTKDIANLKKSAKPEQEL